MNFKSLFQFVFLCLFFSNFLNGQMDSFFLWKNGEIPYSIPSDRKETLTLRPNGTLTVQDITQPCILPFFPTIKTNNKPLPAVIICPGGGYWLEAIGHEGFDFAKWFIQKGIAAFVLKYRLPDDKTMTDKQWVPSADALRAIQMVRQRAAEWNIDTGKIGIMGFSAGGHLAATASTHYDSHPLDFKNPSARPDFSILVYPVISLKEETTHAGSRSKLLGNNPAYDLVKEFSNELKVNSHTPPTFLVHAADDTAVPVENSLFYAASLARNKVPYEMHIFPTGGHGFGLAGHLKGNVNSWTDNLLKWLVAQQLTGQ